MYQKLFKNVTHIALSNPHNCKINAIIVPDLLQRKKAIEGLINELTLQYLGKAGGGVQTQGPDTIVHGLTHRPHPNQDQNTVLYLKEKKGENNFWPSILIHATFLPKIGKIQSFLRSFCPTGV